MSNDGVQQLCDGAEAWHVQTRPIIDSLDQRVRDGSHGPGLVAPWTHFIKALRSHFAEEEGVLFPALRVLERGGTPEGERWKEVLAEMERELDEFRTIADAVRNAARDAGPLEMELLELLDSLEEHARIEEEELVPAARALLGVPDPAAKARAQASHATPPRPAPAKRDGGRLRRTARRLRGLLGR
jgi:hypothetical protein